MFTQQDILDIHKRVRLQLGIGDPALGTDLEFQDMNQSISYERLEYIFNLIGESDRIVYQHHKDTTIHRFEKDLETPYLLVLKKENRILLVESVSNDGIVAQCCMSPEQKPRESYTTDQLAQLDYTIITFHQVPIRVGVEEGPFSDAKKLTEPIHPIKRLWNLLASQKHDIYLIYFYGLIAGLLSLVLPLTIQSITGLVSGGLVLQPVVLLIGVAIVATIVTGVIQIMQQTIIEAIQRRIFANTSIELAFKMPRFDSAALKNIYTPELVNRFFDVLTLQKSVSKLLIDFVTVKLTLIFGLLLLTFYHPYFIVFSVILLILLFFLFYFTGAKGLETSLMESKYKYKLVFWLEEMARTMNAFKLAGNPPLSVQHTREHLGGYLNRRKAHFRILITQFSAVVIFKSIVTAGTLILGTVLVINREITLGQFIASEIIIITVLSSVEKFIQSFETIYDMLTALDKVAQLTEKPLERSAGLVLRSDNKKLRSYEFKGVSLKYPERTKPALNNVNLRIEPGQIIGFMGSNGSGRSSLLKILSGLETSYSGIFRINDIPLKDLHLPSYRFNIGDNLSTDSIFEGSIFENISVGRDGISIENVRDAILKVGLEDFVDGQPNGIQSKLLSGGMGLNTSTIRQIILARSICGNPDLLIFDDFYGYLPKPKKNEFLDIICGAAKNWTVVAATHDLRYLSRCDVIHIMEEGSIVESGSVEELSGSDRFQALISNKNASN